jgi:serine protease Do
MRHSHLLALTAVALAAAVPAGAQTRREPAPRRTEPTPAPDRRTFIYRSGEDESPRAALGVSTSATGTARDTLGLLITSVTRGGPAEKAGLEEGNRLAAINGVSLRAAAADVEDYESSGALSRRLVRELTKVKPGDEVELRVYRDGRTQPVKVRTVSSDSLFRRNVTFSRMSRSEMDERPALGIGIGSSGNRRDTLGVLIMSVQDSTPAARAGLEEGNRIAAINGVNLRVSAEDAGDASVGRAKAQRLQREVAKLKPSDNVTLRVYANGQFRDVTMKVARAGDLPRSSRMNWIGDGAAWFFPGMPPAAPLPPSAPMHLELNDLRPMELEMGPELRARMEGVRAQLDRVGPELARVRPELEKIRPQLDKLRPELERIRPEMERMRLDVPRALERMRAPNVRIRLDGSRAGMTI